MTTTHISPAKAPVATFDQSAPLKLATDQPQTWRDFGEDGIDFFEAANAILAADRADGVRAERGIARLDGWAFGPDREGYACLGDTETGEHFKLRSHAFAQLCSRVSAPAAYIRTLPSKLQTAALNWGIAKEATQNGNLLRLADGEVRALLSDRYVPLDNAKTLSVLESALDAAGLLHDVRVRSIATGGTASMRIVIPGDDIVIENPREVGDIVSIGLDLLNGEIGNRSVSVCPVTWRLVCKNGMRSADRSAVARLRHVGDADRLLEAFTDAVPKALAEARGLRTHMATAVDRMIDDALADIDRLRGFGLTVAETRDVARDLAAERKIALPGDPKTWGDVDLGEVSVFDVSNAMTHFAQTKDTDRRVQIEEAAGAYLVKRAA